MPATLLPSPRPSGARRPSPPVAGARTDRQRHARRRLVEQRRLVRRRRTVAVAILAVAVLLVGLDVARGARPVGDLLTAVTVGDPLIGDTTAGGDPGGGPAVDGSPVASPTGPLAVGSPAVGPSATPSAAPTVVERGAGTFTIAPGAGPTAGTGGELLRYRVATEDGTGQQAAPFAAAIETILGDPRSWTAGGARSFQRVDDDTADFTVRLASPATVDRLCYPLDTNGYTSCRQGDTVVINLARWLTGVPEYGGDLDTYRNYVVNHEVGHRLGRGHERCTGPGAPAPVMQQQTLGLDGCARNGWPFPDPAGDEVTGPPV